MAVRYPSANGTEKEIRNRIAVLSRQLVHSINLEERQEYISEIEYLETVLRKRRANVPKKVNFNKTAPTIRDHRERVERDSDLGRRYIKN